MTRRVTGLAAVTRTWHGALALKACHPDHGAYPVTLAERQSADWTLPTDPFTRKPCRCRQGPAGFTVWRVGFDLKGDGARPLPDEWDALTNPGYGTVVR